MLLRLWWTREENQHSDEIPRYKQKTELRKSSALTFFTNIVVKPRAVPASGAAFAISQRVWCTDLKLPFCSRTQPSVIDARRGKLKQGKVSHVTWAVLQLVLHCPKEMQEATHLLYLKSLFLGLESLTCAFRSESRVVGHRERYVYFHSCISWLYLSLQLSSQLRHSSTL